MLPLNDSINTLSQRNLPAISMSQKHFKVGRIIDKFSISCFKSFFIKAFHTICPGTEFQDNWHINLIAEYLEAVQRGEIKRLIINIPPRSLKSSIVSVAWPAWVLAHESHKKIICASYSNTLSLKHSVESRLIMASDWYRLSFPKTKIRKGSDTQEKFITTKQGFRFATSIEGTLTGEGADFLILDDPHTPMQALSTSERTRAIQWFDQSFITRLNDKKQGAVIVIMQRLHTDDLTGHLLKKKHWALLKLQSISDSNTTYKINNNTYNRNAGDILFPEREDAAVIESLKVEMGSYAFNAQYQQSPQSLEGSIISSALLTKVDVMPASFEAIYHSWDCASKTGMASDYTVCTVWGVLENKFYLIDVIRKKLEFPALKKQMLALHMEYSPEAILIEDKSAGTVLIQEAQQNSLLPIIPVIPTQDKVTRLLSVSSCFEAGRVVLPRHAHWLSDYELEITNFPTTSHDDQVDSTSQFLAWYGKKHSKISRIRRV